MALSYSIYTVLVNDGSSIFENELVLFIALTDEKIWIDLLFGIVHGILNLIELCVA